MAVKIIMPKQGLQMTEGLITAWLASEGDNINAGEPLFEMETDKLAITIDSPVSGTLLKIVAPEGETVPITETIAIAGALGEDISGFLKESREHGGRVLISPRAKRLALESGVDWLNLHGSAPGGMIVERDILAAKTAAPIAPPPARDQGANMQERAPGQQYIEPISAMRKSIAERVKRSLGASAENTASAASGAQAIHRISVFMDEFARIRESMNKSIGYTGAVAFAAVRALQDYPSMNVEWTDEGILYKNYVNLGVAVALDNGLIAPVVKNAHHLTLNGISGAIDSLVQKAKAGELLPDDCSGGGFTVSNLGMYGLDDFDAIINPPESGILAVGRIGDAPVAIGGRVEIRKVMKLTLTYDHRAIDGAQAAMFLSRVKDYLEKPFLML